jgi:Protein of unknown function (DUF1524)
MPSHQRVRLHDEEQLPPRNQAGQSDERQPRGVIGSPRPNLPLDVQRQLLAQEQILGDELGARLQHRRGEPHDIAEDADDRADVEATRRLDHRPRVPCLRANRRSRRQNCVGPMLLGPESTEFCSDPVFADHSLVQLDNDDWRPAALWALKNRKDDPAFLDTFLGKLERLAASFLLRRIYTTPRVGRYLELLKQLDAGDGVGAAAFELGDDEKKDTRERIAGEIYLVNPVRKYVLLRLDSIIAANPGASYAHKIITVEHVLPQNPKDDSQWVKDFTDEERAHWTHRLGNLLLLNRTKNSEAQNYDFAIKKSKYFTSSKGAALFALTTQVLGHDDWTPAVVERRHTELTKKLADEWGLN